MPNNLKSKDSKTLRKLITQLEINLCDQINNSIMKTNTFVRTDFKIQAFEATRIIFDDSDLVSLNIRSRIKDRMLETTLLFTFARFNDLLRFSGEAGDKLQCLVSDKLLSNDERPYIIEMKNDPLIFSSCSIDLSYLIADDESCFSVEEIMPLSFLQQAKNLRNNIKDFNCVHIDNKVHLNNALNEIATMYRYYLGLLELNLQEGIAREKAGLCNDKLFKIAFHAATNSK